MALDRYKQHIRAQAEMPIRVKQLSRSLENLAEVTYRQLPFARAEKESLEDYKSRIKVYFDKLYSVEKELFAQLSEEDQAELADAFAKVDMQCRECMLELENAKLEMTQEELLELYQNEEDKFAAFAEDPKQGEG